MSRQLTSILNLAVCLGIILQPSVSALESDGDQQVIWSSEGDSTMSIQGNIRILEMSANVRVTQGTLEILGDEAIFEYEANSNELKKVTVSGSPVRYQQQLDEDGALVKGTSDTLIFYTDELDETILELLGNANIESPDSTMRCEAIVYISDRDLIREATGPCQGTLSSQPN
ncbi:MAG: LptA/OstA family protein [Pseudomonadota bacterium]|nr:LptA/OstA family protein [Pseudomonadota bacterium]